MGLGLGLVQAWLRPASGLEGLGVFSGFGLRLELQLGGFVWAGLRRALGCWAAGSVGLSCRAITLKGVLVSARPTKQPQATGATNDVYDIWSVAWPGFAKGSGLLPFRNVGLLGA